MEDFPLAVAVFPTRFVVAGFPNGHNNRKSCSCVTRVPNTCARFQLQTSVSLSPDPDNGCSECGVPEDAQVCKQLRPEHPAEVGGEARTELRAASCWELPEGGGGPAEVQQGHAGNHALGEEGPAVSHPLPPHSLGYSGMEIVSVKHTTCIKDYLSF